MSTKAGQLHTADDARLATPKVEVARRNVQRSHTASHVAIHAFHADLLTPEGLRAALDCDVLLSCVDRPLPRHLLNAVAYGHLIPVIDGGILARVDKQGRPLHVDWRILTVGPTRRCLYCAKALRRSDVALDREGLLDDPDYIKGLSENDRELVGRRSVFAFSLSVASHETLQLVSLVTGIQRIGGIGPQHYAGYPGRMTVKPASSCDDDCDINQLTSSAVDLSGNLRSVGGTSLDDLTKKP